MSLADFDALLRGEATPPPMRWSPRECVWLMYLAEQRASTNPRAKDLVRRLRALLIKHECTSAPEGQTTP